MSCDLRAMQHRGASLLMMEVIFLFMMLLRGHMTIMAASSNCSVFSSTDADLYWDAVARCPACMSESGCGYCLSTLMCLPGIDESGPTDGSSCPDWIIDSNSCPAVPNCGDYVDCAGKYLFYNDGFLHYSP